ncbi:hypothetical protein CspHIS471_0305640 [Cutaneotrichosporon sp. HIS471]|nr:hypothetical protein CspHIS471_0305640 [Cutaneotrichosporon sp. HIS471]
MLAFLLLFLGLVLAAPAPQAVSDLPSPKSTFLPEGPTTVVYTWTYPYTQTKTVVYGGPDWTTYVEYTTIDGTQVLKTVVAPTRVAISSPVAASSSPAVGKGKDCSWVMILVIILGMLVLSGLAAWFLLHRRKTKRAAVATTVPVVKKSPSIASSDASSTYSKEEA